MSPSRAEFAVLGYQQVVFLSGPGTLIDGGIQVVLPSLSALADGSTTHGPGNLLPVPCPDESHEGGESVVIFAGELLTSAEMGSSWLRFGGRRLAQRRNLGSGKGNRFHLFGSILWESSEIFK
jgi:hypothetical protein